MLQRLTSRFLFQAEAKLSDEHLHANALLTQHQFDFIHVPNSLNQFDKNNLACVDILRLIAKVPDQHKLDLAQLLVEHLPYLSQKQILLLIEKPNCINQLKAIYDSVLKVDRSLAAHFTLTLSQLTLALKRDSNKKWSQEYVGFEEFICIQGAPAHFDDNMLFTIVTFLMNLERFDTLEILLGCQRSKAILHLFRNRDYHAFLESQVQLDDVSHISRYNFETFSALIRVPQDCTFQLSKLIVVFPRSFTQSQLDYLCEQPEHIPYLLEKCTDYFIDEPTIKNLCAHFEDRETIVAVNKNLLHVDKLAYTFHWLDNHGIATHSNKLMAIYNSMRCGMFATLPLARLGLLFQSTDINQIIFTKLFENIVQQTYGHKIEKFHTFFARFFGGVETKVIPKVDSAYKCITRKVVRDIYTRLGDVAEDFLLEELLLKFSGKRSEQVEIKIEELMKIIDLLIRNKEYSLLEKLVGEKRSAAIESIYHQSYTVELIRKVLEIDANYAWDFISLVQRFRKIITEEQIDLVYTHVDLIRPLYNILNSLYHAIHDVAQQDLCFPYKTSDDYLHELNTEELITLAHDKLSYAKEFAFAVYWLNQHGIATTDNIHHAYTFNQHTRLLQQINIKDLLADTQNSDVIQKIFADVSVLIINNLQQHRLINTRI